MLQEGDAMNSLANNISILRIILTFVLLWIRPLSPLFYVVYIAAGVSDILDGYIARRTNTASETGEKLDSAADLILIVVLISVLYPVIRPDVPVLIWTVCIGLIRTASIILAGIKYRTFGSIHTYANKLTGLLLFLAPLLLGVIHREFLFYGICLIATVSALEELLLHLVSRELQANRKSIFSKRI